MNPYPLIYCPKGTDRPTCCPSPHIVSIVPGKGPDAAFDADGKPTDLGGLCFGGTLQPGLRWAKTPKGWWIGLHPQHQPQHLRRVALHPRGGERQLVKVLARHALKANAQTAGAQKAL